MTAGFALFIKLIPLYVTVALGWIAGRYLEASSRNIAGIMLYIVTPSVVFSGVMAAPLSTEVILLPFLIFAIASVLCVFQTKVATDSRRSLPPIPRESCH